MPKTDIDYTNTIIYKITCKDVAITDVYVGHTTNFVQRKHAHKQSCINVKSLNYNVKLYEVIRANGGWNNWKMEIINFFECKDHYEARKKEQEYFISLHATLNSIEPMPKPKLIVPIIQKTEKDIFFCSICNIYCNSSNLLEEHKKTKKHLKKQVSQLSTEHEILNSSKFNCKLCHFNCSKQSNYDTHLTTSKHLANANGDKGDSKNALFICSNCNKKYVSRNGLWKHKKTCDEELNNIEEETITPHILDSSSSEIKALTNLVLEMVKSNTELQKQQNELQKQNTELQKQVLEVCKNTSNTTINSHNNNKTFNLQFFLNEQCKDAMNISDFADSFDLQLSDLESIGELGYVEGITKLFVDKLNSMDIYKRPIHCSDAKREILYVKDDNKWEREERNNPKLRYAIKTVSFRNMKLAVLWSDTYPESKDGDSHLNDTYMKLIKESTGGNGEISISEDKIIRRIAKNILIEK